MGKVIESGPWEGFEVISEYSDAQAVDDGVLVDIGNARLDPTSTRIVRNARATVGIFSRFAELSRRDYSEMDDDGHRENALLSCRLLFRSIMRRPADEDGWRKTEARQDGESIGEVWLIPNELGGLTLMLPEDY